MKSHTEFTIEKHDLTQRFGALQVEDLAATLLNAFHGKCECASHPFHRERNGEFNGQLPWTRMRPNDGDNVVQAFRLAAIAALGTLYSTGVGKYGLG